jgi:hypothetical protein
MSEIKSMTAPTGDSWLWLSFLVPLAFSGRIAYYNACNDRLSLSVWHPVPERR